MIRPSIASLTALYWVSLLAPPWVPQTEAASPSPSPIKVFLLAGQSNMQGQGVVSMDHPRDYNSGQGNLVWSMTHSASKRLMRHLRDESDAWVVRDDVEIRYKFRGKVRQGPLTIGYTGYGKPTGRHHIGPELQIGHQLGDATEQPVLLIKTAWGGKSLYKDFRSPSAGGETGEFYQKMLTEVQ